MEGADQAQPLLSLSPPAPRGLRVPFRAGLGYIKASQVAPGYEASGCRGQTEKSSLRANVFRSSPNNRTGRERPSDRRRGAECLKKEATSRSREVVIPWALTRA